MLPTTGTLALSVDRFKQLIKAYLKNTDAYTSLSNTQFLLRGLQISLAMEELGQAICLYGSEGEEVRIVGLTVAIASERGGCAATAASEKATRIVATGDRKAFRASIAAVEPPNSELDLL